MLESSVVLSPLVALLAAVVAWVRVWRGRPWKRAVPESVLDVLPLATLFPILVLTLFNPGSGGAISLVPFSDMSSSGFGGMTGLYQNGGNIALFMPLGALLPLAWGHRLAGFARVTAVAATVSVGVEVLQYVLGTGHVTSVDDVLLNSAGALLGAVLTWPWWRAGARMDTDPSAAVGAGGVREG
ncbi:VanZ family protein [Nocardiopsis quinghaiensis]|uniref:VanZ family protein n=1 Tax=Nocardiopsis quinghaiensis TaxID=464995 RepID=UPI001680EE08|nr:VanZ family protein [Nocardiopsis quinghaiensis]